MLSPRIPMTPLTPNGSRSSGWASGRGFVRHEFMILAALILIVLAVALPRLLKEGWKSALLSLLPVAGILVGVIALLVFVVWLQTNLDREGEGWRDKAFRGTGHLLRFLLFAFVGLVVATAVVAQHRLGPALEAVIPLTIAAACGAAGLHLHHRLGKTRFWPAFGKFGLALLGSLFGGILGILGPEPWAVDAGILLPILVFVILASLGRITPR